MTAGNIFESIADNIDNEVFDLIVQSGDFKIERIISRGHSSPQGDWYKQDQNEWVIVLQGESILVLENGEEIHLKVGSHFNIAAGIRHRVKYTAADTETIWLAVHY